MSDYGHDLLFGTFITPTAQQPQQAVLLAQLSEQAGLDLATFQDHPYQPAFLDTWTLMSYAAARTERIHLSANVINLPCGHRPCWPARRRAWTCSAAGASSSRSVQGRSGTRSRRWAGHVWRQGSRSRRWRRPSRSSGPCGTPRPVVGPGRRKHHRVVGAKRGPAPAHDIPIWVGALRPRMLRLVGRVADGWLPSLSRLDGRRGSRLATP